MNAPPSIGVQLYSLRDACTVDFPGVIQRVAEMGYVGVELAGLHDLAPDEVGRMFADAGLRVASAHVGLDPPDAYEAALDTYQALGAEYVVVPAIWPEGFADADALATTAERLNSVYETVKARSLTLGYHNHFWEMEKIDDRPALLALFDLLEPGIVAEVDIYWARVGGIDPVDLLRELGSRVELLHVKDGPIPSTDEMVAVGDGAIDVPAALAAAPTARWHVVELDQCATDMEQAILRSYEYLVANGLSTGRT